MRAFAAFTKKEFTENLRTYKLLILAAVMVALGIMSPLVAKIMPDLLSGVDLGGGIILTMPEPVATDSWAQFFSNVAQMGMLALIITFCGIMSGELSKGTLINLLTKGMKRHTVILSKFLSASVIWLLSYLLCLAVCYAYTYYFWPDYAPNDALLVFSSVWLFGEMMIAVLIFGGAAFGSFYGGLLTCGGVVIALNLLNILPKVRRFNPVTLAGGTLELLLGTKTAADFMPAMYICAGAVVFLIIASIVIFNKKKV